MLFRSREGKEHIQIQKLQARQPERRLPLGRSLLVFVAQFSTYPNLRGQCREPDKLDFIPAWLNYRTTPSRLEIIMKGSLVPCKTHKGKRSQATTTIRIRPKKSLPQRLHLHLTQFRITDTSLAHLSLLSIDHNQRHLFSYPNHRITQIFQHHHRFTIPLDKIPLHNSNRAITGPKS